MPLRQNKPVAIRPVWITRIVAQHIKIQSGHDFSRRERAARMARTSLGNHLDHRAPHRLGDGSQLSDVTGLLHGFPQM